MCADMKSRMKVIILQIGTQIFIHQNYSNNYILCPRAELEHGGEHRQQWLLTNFFDFLLFIYIQSSKTTFPWKNYTTF